MLPDEGVALRGFVARIIGWAPERAEAVEHVLRSIELAVSHQAALVLLGETDLVRIAQALHRRTLGADAPFVVCDPRRRNTPASARSPAGYEDAGEAFAAAAGGTLCVYRRRLPRDFSAVVAMSREPDASVQLVICGGRRDKYEALLAALAPILVPSLQERAGELPRIVEEYAADAGAALSATVPLTSKDRDWICKHCASSLHEIEDATLRIVALREAGPERDPSTLRQEAEPVMRFLTAHVRNGRLVLDEPTNNTVAEHVVDAITFDTVTDEHVRWYQASMPDSPTTRDVIMAATSDLPVLRWLGRRRLAATIHARLELVSADDGGDLLNAEERDELGRALEASFDEEEAGELIDAADALADLRIRRWRWTAERLGDGAGVADQVAQARSVAAIMGLRHARRG